MSKLRIVRVNVLLKLTSGDMLLRTDMKHFVETTLDQVFRNPEIGLIQFVKTISK